jgi:hypothetical protein
MGGRSPWPAPFGVVPLAGDEVSVPAQDRGGGDREDLRPPAAAHQPRQRRKPQPVGVIPPHPNGQLTAHDLVLVAQHQQLGVLGQIGADQHCQQANKAPQQPVDERQQHPEMVPATPLIPQQNPSSQYETEFPSGTGSTSSPRPAARPPQRPDQPRPVRAPKRPPYAADHPPRTLPREAHLRSK